LEVRKRDLAALENAKQQMHNDAEATAKRHEDLVAYVNFVITYEY